MKLLEPEIFSINNFEGPLDLLWHLIHHQELDIYEISLSSLTQQYLARMEERCQNADAFLDSGAEFVALAASLAYFKSKALLPKHGQEKEENADDLDPRFDIIHHLVDYCRFKDAAKELAEREQQQARIYFRGIESDEAKKNLGIQHLSLEDLASLFKQILAKSVVQKGVIQEELWKVCDKIDQLRLMLKEMPTLLFLDVFSSDKSREELIVTFLALLELMKSGEAMVVHQIEQNTICICEAFFSQPLRNIKVENGQGN